MQRIPHVVSGFNVVKGFLNIELSQDIFIDEFAAAYSAKDFGCRPADPKAPAVMVEYSSPNTNKPAPGTHPQQPLGFSVARLLEASGKRVIKTQIVNDRGIHICKSMLAWQRFGHGETPESSGMKGDHLVGKYYVEFDKAYRQEVAELKNQGMDEEEAKKKAPLMLAAQDMLRRWEARDPEVRALWEMMNGWVFEGFAQTYRRLGVEFDKNYYESDTYLLGKDIVEEGLKKGVFYRRDDGSVWIDDGRRTGRKTGAARGRNVGVHHPGHGYGRSSVRGVRHRLAHLHRGQRAGLPLQGIVPHAQETGYPLGRQTVPPFLRHGGPAFGQNEVPEGTVVDADDLMDDMYRTAKEISEELGKLDGLSDQEKDHLYHIIGMGALKYFLLKVDPRKRMMFNPQESIDFNGNTGPFIQYTYARIQSIKRRAGQLPEKPERPSSLQEREVELIKNIAEFPALIQKAAAAHSPALVANYVYELVKMYNSYYQNVPMLSAEDASVRTFRVQLSDLVGRVIRTGMYILGIEVPERM